MGFSAFLAGVVMGLGLIVAIGPQNAFVLRQGLRNEHVFPVSLTCAISDAMLITVGVTSFANVARVLPWLDPLMRFGGAAFLVWYGGRSLIAALRSRESLAPDPDAQPASLVTTLISCLALTWLNPHVYLDTVVLLGSVSTQFPGAQLAFGTGATIASFAFFFALGYAAIWLRPVFAKPAAWRVLEGSIAIIMWAIAARLVLGH